MDAHLALHFLDGIGRRMPWTMTAFTIAGFGLVGTPGTVGFISKWYLATRALEGNHHWVLLALSAAIISPLGYLLTPSLTDLADKAAAALFLTV